MGGRVPLPRLTSMAALCGRFEEGPEIPALGAGVEVIAVQVITNSEEPNLHHLTGRDLFGAIESQTCVCHTPGVMGITDPRCQDRYTIVNSHLGGIYEIEGVCDRVSAADGPSMDGWGVGADPEP